LDSAGHNALYIATRTFFL